MTHHRIRKGLDLPIAGVPEQSVEPGPPVQRVALLADDFPGLRPRMRVEEGQKVQRGQVLFEDRRTPGVVHTAPAAGRVIGIHRGARRALRSIVIDLSEGERAGRPPDREVVDLAAQAKRAIDARPEALRALLLASGLWTALRTRPWSRVPTPDSTPAAIFVTAIDTQPLAPRPEVVLEPHLPHFERGLRALASLTDGPTHLCLHHDAGIAERIDAPVRIETFEGPHPAGTVGLHIHLLAPVSRSRTVWHVGYQDVLAIGRLLRHGQLDVERVVSLAGPPVRRPRLLRTRLGAQVEDLAQGELEAGDVRLISGSVLSGKKAMGEVFGYLGRFDLQVSCLLEGRSRALLGWAGAGRRVFSILPIFASGLGRPRTMALTTSLQGSPRAMVPIGLYEKVMPMDVLPTHLLRALIAGDLERAEELGALELDEEDLALCTFVDPGKTDYGPILRHTLERLAEGQ